MLERIGDAVNEIERRATIQYILLALITLLAAALRFWKLGEWSFWIDESLTVQRAQDVLANGVVGMLRWSPSMGLIATAISLQPLSEWSARLVPALIGILTIPALFFPIRRLYGATVSLISAFLLAVSPAHVYWSQNARHYTLLLLLYTLALLYFYFAVEERRPRYMVFSALALVFALWERLSAGFAVPVAMAYVIAAYMLFGQKTTRLSPRIIMPLLVPPILIGLFDVFGSGYIGRSSIVGDFAKEFMAVTNKGPFRLMLAIVYRLGPMLFCVASVAGVYVFKAQWSRKTLFILASILVPLGLMLAMALVIFTRDRYYVNLVIVFWLILSAVLIKELLLQPGMASKLAGLALFGVLLADSASQMLLYYQYQHGLRLDLRGAYEYVAEHRSPDAIIASTEDQHLVGDYYLGETVVSFNELDLDALKRSGTPAWFVVESDIGWTPARVQTWLDENAELVKVDDIAIPGRETKLRVYAYGEN